jgi:hypothetical protein
MRMIVVADSYLAANEGTKEIERRLLVLTPHFEMERRRSGKTENIGLSLLAIACELLFSPLNRLLGKVQSKVRNTNCRHLEGAISSRCV